MVLLQGIARDQSEPRGELKSTEDRNTGQAQAWARNRTKAKSLTMVYSKFCLQQSTPFQLYETQFRAV